MSRSLTDNSGSFLSGIAIAALGAAFFSLKPVIIKLAYGYGVDSVTLMTLRMLYALPFYLIPLWFWLGRNSGSTS